MTCLCILATTCLLGHIIENEFPQPIYNPYSQKELSADYCPAIIYDKDAFSSHGHVANYKMWHEGPEGIALSCSMNGLNWELLGKTNLNGTHPVVVYDKNGFEDGKYFYKIWYWTGVGGTAPDVIQHSHSVDGIVWSSPVSVTQDKEYPLVTGNPDDLFFSLYGPGFLMYNPSPTFNENNPYSYPYVMFYDAVSSLPRDIESTGLAYSKDGVHWKRYYSEPILVPSENFEEWDSTNIFRPYVIKHGEQGFYSMFYCGSNRTKAADTALSYGHGIGYALSLDGIHWIKYDLNPLLSCFEGTEWRNGRTYRPSIDLDPVTLMFKIWFVGGAGAEAGKSQGIGYAEGNLQELFDYYTN